MNHKYSLEFHDVLAKGELYCMNMIKKLLPPNIVFKEYYFGANHGMNIYNTLKSYNNTNKEDVSYKIPVIKIPSYSSYAPNNIKDSSDHDLSTPLNRLTRAIYNPLNIICYDARTGTSVIKHELTKSFSVKSLIMMDNKYDINNLQTILTEKLAPMTLGQDNGSIRASPLNYKYDYETGDISKYHDDDDGDTLVDDMDLDSLVEKDGYYFFIYIDNDLAKKIIKDFVANNNWIKGIDESLLFNNDVSDENLFKKSLEYSKEFVRRYMRVFGRNTLHVKLDKQTNKIRLCFLHNFNRADINISFTPVNEDRMNYLDQTVVALAIECEFSIPIPTMCYYASDNRDYFEYRSETNRDIDDLILRLYKNMSSYNNTEERMEVYRRISSFDEYLKCKDESVKNSYGKLFYNIVGKYFENYTGNIDTIKDDVSKEATMIKMVMDHEMMIGIRKIYNNTTDRRSFLIQSKDLIYEKYSKLTYDDQYHRLMLQSLYIYNDIKLSLTDMDLFSSEMDSSIGLDLFELFSYSKLFDQISSDNRSVIKTAIKNRDFDLISDELKKDFLLSIQTLMKKIFTKHLSGISSTNEFRNDTNIDIKQFKDLLLSEIHYFDNYNYQNIMKDNVILLHSYKRLDELLIKIINDTFFEKDQYTPKHNDNTINDSIYVLDTKPKSEYQNMRFAFWTEIKPEDLIRIKRSDSGVDLDSLDDFGDGYVYRTKYSIYEMIAKNPDNRRLGIDKNVIKDYNKRNNHVEPKCLLFNGFISDKTLVENNHTRHYKINFQEKDKGFIFFPSIKNKTTYHLVVYLL